MADAADKAQQTEPVRASPGRCLMCGLAMVCSQNALAQEPEPRPRAWTSPPSLAYAGGKERYSFSGPALVLRSKTPHAAVRGLMDIGGNLRGPNIRGGIGFDLDLPDSGKLHLDVLPARDVSAQGMRWQLSGEDQRLDGKLWSLGSCLEVVREAPRRSNGYGQRHIELAPQLVIDADRLLGTGGQGRLILQRVHWTDQQQRDTGVGAIWQLRLVWQY